MELRSRDGVWYVHGWAWDPKANRRRRVRKSTGIKDDGTARNRKLAEQAGHAIVQSAASGQARRRKSVSLRRALELHIQALERKEDAAATIGIALEKAKPALKWFKPDFDIARFTDEPGVLLKYIDHRLKQPGARRGTTLSRGTIHRELRTLRDAQRDANKAGEYEGELLTIPELGTIYTPKDRTLDEDEFRRLVMALRPPGRRDHLILYRQLGLDEGELPRMQREDIDFDANEVLIRGTKTEARHRYMAMPPEVREILERRCRELPADEPLFMPWVNVDRDLKQTARRIGSEPLCLKDLRRSFATELAEANVEKLLLQNLMGHKSGRMLEHVYARIRRGRHLQKAMAHVSRVRSQDPKEAKS